ncbi:MAG: YigZ family protein [Variovorax sp.]|nr:MAG: YigZ family protein [Variovorax sp.]
MIFTLADAVHSELVIRKSRFIGRVQPVADRAAALAVVAGLRGKHPGAAHVCWALMAGGQSAANDDGEPQGTAGRPMLEVLRHQQLEGVLATVVRYFGGVKLGAGGLVRAYTDAVAQALLGAATVPLVRQRSLSCAVPYALEGTVRRELAAAGATLGEVRHADDVHIDFSVPEPVADALIAALGDAAQGRVVWQPA